jgi:hypothetical protein
MNRILDKETEDRILAAGEPIHAGADFSRKD